MLGSNDLPSIVGRLQSSLIRKRPDLQEMHILALVVVVLARKSQLDSKPTSRHSPVSDARSSRGHLDVATFQDFHIVQRIPVRQFAIDDWSQVSDCPEEIADYSL